MLERIFGKREALLGRYFTFLGSRKEGKKRKHSGEFKINAFFLPFLSFSPSDVTYTVSSPFSFLLLPSLHANEDGFDGEEPPAPSLVG